MICVEASAARRKASAKAKSRNMDARLRRGVRASIAGEVARDSRRAGTCGKRSAPAAGRTSNVEGRRSKVEGRASGPAFKVRRSAFDVRRSAPRSGGRCEDKPAIHFHPTLNFQRSTSNVEPTQLRQVW